MLNVVLSVQLKLPQGVSPTEAADHIEDAHRMAVRGYHPSDPLSEAGEIRVEPQNAGPPLMKRFSGRKVAAFMALQIAFPVAALAAEEKRCPPRPVFHMATLNTPPVAT